MINIQRADRNMRIAALTYSGQVTTVPGLLAARKHVIEKRGWSEIKKYPDFFAFVSSPKIYKQDQMRKLAKGWCHPLRKPHKKLPTHVPCIMMPESDFMDPMFIPHKAKNEHKYDYFYFTVNAPPGIENKGLCTFIDMLPVLCSKKLRGYIVVYYPNMPRHKSFTVGLDSRRMRTLKKFSSFLTYHWGLLKPEGVDRVMSMCRFGLFPNTVDNSPRLISESLIRDTPVLMNNKIHGGWHYVNKQTGSLFDSANISEKVDLMMESSFHPRSSFLSNFGFRNSSARLAGFLSDLFGYDKYSHMYFDVYKDYLKEISQ